jgi:alpha-D-ribose 1-methylphosphonate 5-triphosphate synthase subunit PhnG
MPFVDTAARRRWMGILAKARPEEVDACWSRLGGPPAYDLLRRPETGLVMVRGRVGGDGPAFNLGEMAVTRCSVRLADGTVGHAWIAGRAAAQAEQAAVIDALLQGSGGHGALADELHRLDLAHAARRDDSARKAAATRVDFFTMVRGEA